MAISIPAAAELTGLGEPAIRRAFREGRVDVAFQWHVGREATATYLDLPSVLTCYGVVEATVESNIKRWAAHAPVIHTPDGERWIILDLIEPMMFRKGGR